ncbi:MAG: class I SAM-dependent methyltransferase [Methylophilaceae bacterium]
MATQDDIQAHYDLDNDFFALFLDQEYRVYSCGVWQTATSLEDAQKDKLERLSKFAHLADGQKVLDVGCGWGGLMLYITDQFPKTMVHGLTLSAAQHAHIQSAPKARISVELRAWQDFSAPENKFDAIISIGAFEHFASVEDHTANVHRKVYSDFFNWCRTVTTNEACVGLQTIVINRAPINIGEVRDSRYLLEKVFPGSALPSVSDIQAALVDQYEIVELRLIGQDYARTLGEWNIRLNANREKIVEKYGAPVFEHYQTYFGAAKRSFESGFVDLLQVSLRRPKAIKIHSVK